MLPTEELKDALHSVTTIPVIPFRNGRIDYAAHEKNICYLMENNHLSGNRPRVICIAGTSLIHHVSLEDQNKLIEVTGGILGGEGILVSAIAPNPIGDAGVLVEKQAAMPRAPDAYLLMPLNGVYSVEGLYEGLSAFGEKCGTSCGARFLYYYRQPRDRGQIIRLLKDSPHFVAVKIGTDEEDVPVFVEGVADNAMVIWGVGDRSTKAAQLGATGHTSGISLLLAKAGDGINNAQRSGDFNKAWAIEKRINALEELRFENGREFNYSAVVEAMILSGFKDIDGGEGGPFNPRVPADVVPRVQQAIEGILDLH
jgi:dihydrodipicolinate synthase/N-acetylneuraminate lyase